MKPFRRVDAFGSNNSKQKNQLYVSSKDLDNLEPRTFLAKAEDLGIQEIIFDDMNKSEVDEFLSTTPSIVLKKSRPPTDIELVVGESKNE
ncbi:MAG: hypothetical protein V5A72_01310 [Candidatus Nanohaloarchaea archaeon]